ncbi:hypothetical protein R1sor_027401 [Riccia sorocarpa]|uniref:Uncharacterized protein n=1 Tax=Riccia sorocarpa TaxID=122646 RepID=A0ABD3GEU7_9MARC
MLTTVSVSWRMPLPEIVVGLELGITYSGFAYALASDMKSVYEYCDWPGHAAVGRKPYFKTETSLRYIKYDNNRDGFRLEDWGWDATTNHGQALEKCKVTGRELKSFLVKRFKLLQASVSNDSSTSNANLNTNSLPVELTAERMVTDYLRCISSFIMNTLAAKLGTLATNGEVQRCLTAPAKAASVYCQSRFDYHFGKGTKFLVVDAGGETVDLVLHEKVSSSGPRVKEVACTTGRLCGGSSFDEGFHAYLTDRISCYEKFRKDFPAIVMKLQEFIEDLKYYFDVNDKSFPIHLDLPTKLVVAWENFDKENGTWHEDTTYDQISISEKEVRKVFDSVLDPIVDLIRVQIAAVPDIQAIMVMLRNPNLFTDAEVHRVGVWSYYLPRQAQRMADAPSVEVAMFFGRTRIEITLVPLNFQPKNQHMKCAVNFEADFY